jgi:hypothetical protein
MCSVKAMLMRFQMEMRMLLGVRVNSNNLVTLWQRISLRYSRD